MKNEIPSHVQALIFDLDGTLIDSKQAHVLAWRKVMESDGKNMSDDDYEALKGRTSHAFAEGLQDMHGLSLPSEEAKTLKDAFYIELLHCVVTYHQTMDLVQSYHQRLPLALGTNEDKEVAHRIIEFLNIKRFFDIVVTSSEVANPKPAPDLFLECARRMHVEPAHCHVFEDSPVGIQAAKAAGMGVTDVTKFFNS